MSHRIDATFENGVFRPEVPVNIPNGERVSLDVQRARVANHVAQANEIAARFAFEQSFGSIDLGQPVGIDNAAIDADLAREYRRAYGSS